MLNYSIAQLLFNLNSIISIIKRKAALETIAKKVVANACKPYKSSGRKSRAKALLLSTNATSLPSSSIYTPPTLLV